MQLKKYQDDLLDEFEKFLDTCRVEDSPARAFAQSTGEWLGYVAPYRPLPTTANNPQAEETPFVCLRVPTGGGKTFLAAHAIQRVTRSYLPSDYALTLWLVPTEATTRWSMSFVFAGPSSWSMKRTTKTGKSFSATLWPAGSNWKMRVQTESSISRPSQESGQMLSCTSPFSTMA